MLSSGNFDCFEFNFPRTRPTVLPAREEGNKLKGTDTSHQTSDLTKWRQEATMCNFTKNYYIYTSCVDPGAHFCKTSTEGDSKKICSKGPHERYIVLPETCPLCVR